MDSRSYPLAAGIVFGIVGLLHLIRALSSWSLTVEGFAIPVWASYLAAILLGFLSYWGFRLSQS